MERFVGLEEMGKRLVALRGTTKSNVAAAGIGITVSALSNYEAGLRIPRDEIKASIANYYHTTVSDLFFCA